MSRILLLLLFTVVTAAGENPTRDVLAEVEKIAGEAGLEAAFVGFCMIPLDAPEDDAVTGYQMNKALVPASTMKAITTATALEVLGREFRFETKLEITAEPDSNGNLSGNVIVKGGGDPTLAESQTGGTFGKWKAALSAAGIRSIDGAIIGDGSILGTQRVPDTWQWGDIGNYYGAGASGLTFHQNQFFCTFRTTNTGGRAALSGTRPDLPGIEFINEMRVGKPGSGDQGYIYGAPHGKVIFLRGSVPAGSPTYTIKGALPDPALFCARAFTNYLTDNGIPVTGDPTTDLLLENAGKSVGNGKEIHKETSAPLHELIVLTNHQSNNLRAESIHRMTGFQASGKGTSEAAGEAVRAHWAAKGIDMTGFQMDDGCGLSRANTVTAKQMALILRHAAKSPTFDAFYNSLPTAGRSGTLRSIGKGSAAEGRVTAKSGTISRIKNYAGYVNTRSGDRYAFALFINNYTGSESAVKAKIVRVWEKMVEVTE